MIWRILCPRDIHILVAMDVIVRRPPQEEGGGEGGTAVRGLPSVRQSTETCEE